MNEDQARNRSGNGPENLAVLRHMALNLRREEPSRRSLPKKPRRAARSDAFLAQRLMSCQGKRNVLGYRLGSGGRELMLHQSDPLCDEKESLLLIISKLYSNRPSTM